MSSAPAQLTLLPLTSSAADSPVKISRSRAKVRGLRVNAPDSGISLRESFARWDPASLSWKTSQRSFLVDWTPFSGAWPISGIVLDGSAYELPTLAPLTSGTGFLSWPTPALCGNHNRKGAMHKWPTPAACRPNESEDVATWEERRKTLKSRHKNGNGCGIPLGIAVRAWSAPATFEANGFGTSGEGGENLRTAANGRLNPEWVECLMGFPVGWTDIGGPLPPEKRNTNGSRRARSQGRKQKKSAKRPDD